MSMTESKERGLQIEVHIPSKYRCMMRKSEGKLVDCLVKVGRDEFQVDSVIEDERLSLIDPCLEMREEMGYIASGERRKKPVPLWEKKLLTLQEAAALFGIGVNRLRKMTDDQNCPFVLWNQSKRLIKREQLERYLEKAYSI